MSRYKDLIKAPTTFPRYAQQIWNAFRHNQQCITIDMGYMYWYYKVFTPLLIDIKCKNLLLLDTIVQLFPHVTEIICRETDCIKGHEDYWKREYSAAIVCSNFILGVKERLSKLDKQAKLAKIVIQTEKKSIQDDCKLYTPQFGALGWQVEKGSWFYEADEYENCQITLTRL